MNAESCFDTSIILSMSLLIEFLAKSHTSPSDVAETVLGYLYESDEEQQQQQEPPCLF
jgi:hypothetical protein